MMTTQGGARIAQSSNDYRFRQSHVAYDAELKTSIFYMNPPFRPCFTPELLEDIRMWQHQVKKSTQAAEAADSPMPVKYAVGASRSPGFFNLGGDLNLFVELIRSQNKGGLLEYATACVDVGYQTSRGFDAGVTTIALVQGNALGGGFESALSANVIIAEKGVQMGFPEVLFNLFPGMGAYSFLSRRVSPTVAERMILSGELYSTESLYEMGVVDVLAEAGEGEAALRNYIRQSEKRNHAQELIRHVREKTNQVPYEELLDITQLWVDCALNLTERELKTMERLVRAQNRTINESGDSKVLNIVGR